jgi:hypothetical protein
VIQQANQEQSQALISVEIRHHDRCWRADATFGSANKHHKRVTTDIS